MRNPPRSSRGANPAGPVRLSWPGHGYTLIELMFVLGLAAVLSGLTIPRMLSGLEELRVRGAARFMAGRLQQTRMEAVTRGANAALVFTPANDGVAFTPYVDGNRNGVRAGDIQHGLDRPVGHLERLADQFHGIDFGTLADLPPVDSSSPAPGGDPIRVGAASMVSFTPEGTATPGSLYLRGKGSTQLVVRVFGETGKTRILRFDVRSRTWKPL